MPDKITAKDMDWDTVKEAIDELKSIADSAFYRAPEVFMVDVLAATEQLNRIAQALKLNKAK